MPPPIAGRLRGAVIATNGLTVDDIENVRLLIDVGEWLVAFETLCTQIYEREIRLKPNLILELEALRMTLGARAELTDVLWEDVADE